jgi:hypothetical protein
MSFYSHYSQTEGTGLECRRTRWLVYAVIIAVACSQLAAAIGNVQPHLSANDRSRWCTVWSLAERGTYQIDEITAQPGWNTIDKVSHVGHFYSTKPAMFSTVVAGVYWGVKQFTQWNLEDDRKETVRLILLIVNLVPWMAALIVMAMIVERYARTDSAKIFVLLSAAAGTFLTTFAVTLNNHTVAALCVIFALYPAMRIVVDGKTNPLYFLLCGFFAAFACTTELPAAVFGLAMFLLCFRQHPENTFRFFIPAAMIPLAIFFMTNYQATGSWKPFYLEFGNKAYTEFHDGSKSYWANPQGIDRPQDSWPVYLLHCTIGHHGIFSLSPIFLITLVAWLTLGKWKQFSLKAFLWLGLLLTIIVLGFYLTRTANYNYGGRTAGLRWMFWLIPFWLISMIPVLDLWGRRRGFQLTVVLLLAVSVFSASYPLENPWQHPWLFQLMEHWGWIYYG